MKHNRIVVTGAAGFLGSQLVSDLVHQGFNSIRALKLASDKVPAALQHLHQVEWVSCDICNYDTLKKVMEEAKQVYHCAAIVSYNPKDEPLMFKINIEGTANVVNACLENEVEKLLYVSSIAALGESYAPDLVTEDLPFQELPIVTPYGVCKNRGEAEIYRGIENGLDAIIINPSIIIGGNDPVKGNTKLFSMLGSFYPPGSTGFVDVRDVSACMIKLMNSPAKNERFIVNGENLTYKELLDIVAEAINKPKAAIPLHPVLIGGVWRAAGLLSKLTGKPPFLLRSTAHSISAKIQYSTEKLHSVIEHKFNKVRDIIKVPAAHEVHSK